MRSRLVADPLDASGDGVFDAAWDAVSTNFFPATFPSSFAAPGHGGGNPPASAPSTIVPTPIPPEEAVQAMSAQSGSGGPGSVVAETSGGITFNLVFDAAAMAAPPSFRSGIEQAASLLSAAITDKITVNIKIDYSGTGGGAAAGPDNGQYESYSSVRGDLVNNATSGDTTFNALPTGSTIQGQSQVAVWNPQLKLWGVLGANDTSTDDGSATFATDINSSLLVGVALHELSHALGRVPYGPPYGSQPDIFDLFRFTSPGTRLIDGVSTASAAYFSIDGGNTKIADYGRTSDSSDFLNSGVQGGNDPFNEFYNGSTLQKPTAVDLQQLDALGFHLHANQVPVVTVPQTVISATAGQMFAASSLFSASDADGDTLTYYLYDDSASASSGHFVVNGTVVPAQTAYAVTAAQLAQTTFVAGAGGSSDDLYVKAYDGQAYSGNGYYSYFHVNTSSAAGGNHAPVIAVPQTVISASAGQTFAASSLFSASDADGDTLTYYLYDDSASASSGHFVVSGTVVPAQTAYAVTAAQLAQATFVAGAGGSSDDLYVKAYDGQAYSGNGYYSYFHVNTSGAAAGGNHAPVITVPQTVISATPGQTFAASSLFSATDLDGNVLSFSLYDDSPSASSGHFVVNGVVVPAQTAYAVTAAQLAQTAFVAGTAGTSDDLYVKAFDGQAYSGNGYYSYFHVNTGSPTQVAMVLQDIIHHETLGAVADHYAFHLSSLIANHGFHFLV